MKVLSRLLLTLLPAAFVAGGMSEVAAVAQDSSFLSAMETGHRELTSGADPSACSSFSYKCGLYVFLCGIHQDDLTCDGTTNNPRVIYLNGTQAQCNDLYSLATDFDGSKWCGAWVTKEVCPETPNNKRHGLSHWIRHTCVENGEELCTVKEECNGKGSTAGIDTESCGCVDAEIVTAPPVPAPPPTPDPEDCDAFSYKCEEYTWLCGIQEADLTCETEDSNTHYIQGTPEQCSHLYSLATANGGKDWCEEPEHLQRFCPLAPNGIMEKLEHWIRHSCVEQDDKVCSVKEECANSDWYLVEMGACECIQEVVVTTPPEPTPAPVDPPTPAPVDPPTPAPVDPPTPAPVDPPTDTPVPPPTDVEGDPHFSTWTGEKFDYHGKCDLELMSDPHFDNGKGIAIHIRTEIVRTWSYVKAVALKIGDDILEVEGSLLPKEQRYWLNDKFQSELSMIGGFPVVYKAKGSRQRYIISLGGETKISLGSYKDWVRVDILNPTSELFGDAVGLFGQFGTGYKLGRDGVTRFDDNYDDFGQEWQVPANGLKLFNEISGPQAPYEKCIVPDNAHAEDVATTVKLRGRRLTQATVTRDEAESACSQVGIDPREFEDCVSDVLALDDLDVAEAHIIDEDDEDEGFQTPNHNIKVGSSS